MIFQDSNVQPCSPIAPNFSPTDNMEQQESRMMNILRSYEDQYHQSLYQYENESKSQNNDQNIKTSQVNSISSNIQSSFQPGNSYELEKDIISTEHQSHLPNDNQQNDYLSNLSNFSNRSPGYLISNTIIKDKSMDDLIYEEKDNFSSRQIEQSRSDTSFLNYTFNSHQPLSNPIFEKCKSSQVQISHTYTPQVSKNFYNKPTNLSTLPVNCNEEDSNYNSSDDENGIPLGMTIGSQTSKDLSLHSLNNSASINEDKHIKHKSSRISLTESRLHGKNNSGEFVGKNPSLMTIVEDEDDDVEEEFEYEEDYEEDAENITLENKDDEERENIITKAKSLENLPEKSNEKQITSNFSANFSFIPKNVFQPSESQHNISLGAKRQVQTSNSTNNIPLKYFVKSYAGLNSKIIDLNPSDDDNEYDYEYDENPNSPISLMEASDINEYSHQSGLNGSRTIEDLIEEQKKAAIASSSSAIASMSATSTMRENDQNNNFSNRRIFRKRTNISLSELVPQKRACFTVEDMMRLQNIHFPNRGKNATTNSSDSIIKPHKPRYSEEEMIKDQKISIKNLINEKLKSNNQNEGNDNNTESKLIHIESTFDKGANLISNRSINIDNAISKSDKDNSNNFDIEKDEILDEASKKKLTEKTNINNPEKSQISNSKPKSKQPTHQSEENEQSINEENEVKKDFFFNKNLIEEQATSNQNHSNAKNQNQEQEKFFTAKLIFLLFIIPCILAFLFSHKSSK